MNAAEGLVVGQRIIAERGIDLDAAKLAYKSMHPQVSPEIVELALTLEIATLTELHEPFTVDSVAEQMANQSGAFPWNGPVGNGLALTEYQERFREYAREKLFLRQILGLDEGGE
jgi:hypothetical protein